MVRLDGIHMTLPLGLATDFQIHKNPVHTILFRDLSNPRLIRYIH